METGYKVCDAMTKKPVTVSPLISLQECARIMDAEHVGALLVRDSKGLAGIITEQDIVRKSVLHDHPPSKINAGSIMVSSVKTISPEKDIFEAIALMKDFNIRHLPVVADSRMVGLLTLKDALKIQPQLFELIVDKIELREEENKPVNRDNGEGGICHECGNYAEKLFEKSGVMLCIDCRH